MLIDVILTPAEILRLPERDLSSATCVIFDVLRATSSIVTGLAHGAAAIYPVLTIEEALATRGTLPEALLGGERFGERIEGFDLGNSPLEYQEGVRGKEIVTTTTNGTVALRASEGAKRVLVGALLNLDAVAAKLVLLAPREVVLVCAGTFAEFALEDGYAAGALIAELPEAELTDAAQVALGLVSRFGSALEALETARNGRALLAKGRGAEVRYCAGRGVLDVVGEMRAGKVEACPKVSG